MELLRSEKRRRAAHTSLLSLALIPVFAFAFQNCQVGTSVTRLAGANHSVALSEGSNPRGLASVADISVVEVPTARVAYSSINATDTDTYRLYPWLGQHVALFTESADLDPIVVTRILSALDKAYDFYLGATGKPPSAVSSYQGRLVIAEMPKSCGAGCGRLGAGGIEILSTPYFKELYEGVASRPELFSQVPFYELGRNFFHYSLKIDYGIEPRPHNESAINTGFAVLMRFYSMDAAGVSGSPFGGKSFSDFRAEIEGLVDEYERDPSLTWYNTLRIEEGVPGHYGGADLFASMMMRIARDNGGVGFINKVWREVEALPVSEDGYTIQGRVDNLVVSCSRAAGKNLTKLFTETWRTPVSAAAVAKLSAEFPPAPLPRKKSRDRVKF